MAKTITDLVSKGFVPCIPLSEHQQYDLLAVLQSGVVVKLQVKYAALKNGAIEVKFRTSWADRNGTHMTRYSEDAFDYYAIYCPEKDIVIYVPNTKDCPKVIRFAKPRNNQARKVKWADDYRSINVSPQRLYATHLKR